MNALSNALAQILGPAISDPNLIWVWAGPAIALALQTVVFWWRYRWMNDDTFMTYDKEAGEMMPKTELEEKKGLEIVDESSSEEKKGV